MRSLLPTRSRRLRPNGLPAATEAVPAHRRLHAGALGGFATALLALFGAVVVLRLWRADLTVPFRYSLIDDTKFYLLLIKSVIDHGWFLTNHSLGAPFGQQLYDFPQSADNLNLLVIKLLALIWPQPGTVANLFFLLTFPLTGLAAYFAMRRCHVSIASAAVCSSIFAVLPYHFFRSDSHLFLSAYYALPLAAYLYIRVALGERLFELGPAARGWRRWVTRPTAESVLICLVIGSTGIYYATFAVVLLIGGVILALVARRGRGAALSGIATAILIVVILGGNLAPTLIYQSQHGSNPIVTRSASEGDSLSLSIAYLVLPPLQDRVAPLRAITRTYAVRTPPRGYCEQCYESPGTVGTVGLAWLVLVGIAACVGAPWLVRVSRVSRVAAAGAAISILFGATGGLSSLVRVFVSGDIRAWNRFSVLIAFFALLAVALLLDAARQPLSARRGGAWLYGGLLAVVLLFSVYEQTSLYYVPSYRTDAKEYRSDALFVRGIEHTLAPQSAVLELPYVPFPEGYQPNFAVGQTDPYNPEFNFEYEPGRLYIHSARLRWSYGAMKGRVQDWAAELAAKPLDLILAGAAAAGFQAAVIDQHAYSRSLLAGISSVIARTLHEGGVLSNDREFALYDLRPYRQSLQATHSAAQMEALQVAVLHPLRMTCAPGHLSIFNPHPAAHTATLTGQLSGAGQLGLAVTPPEGPATTVQVRGVAGAISERLSLAPGMTEVAITGQAGAQLIAPTVLDGAFAPFAGGSTTATGIHPGIVGPPCLRVPVGM
jgi:hypothetical protein